MQRRRFSIGTTVADVYAWAQLALLQGICPTMDAQLQRLRQHAPNAAASDVHETEAVCGYDGSGSGPAAAGVAALDIGQSRSEVPQTDDAAPPADVDEEWVRRWTEEAARTSGGSGWAWRGGWRLVQTYPRRPLPRDWGDAEQGSGNTIEGAGLAPQAALAVEQLEGHGST